MGRTASTINLSEREREKLELMASRPKSSQREALRARVILTCAEGKMNKDVAVKLNITSQTVGKWRERFAADRLDGLVDAPRSGHPRTISDQKVEEILTKTLEGTPKEHTHWSRRTMAKGSRRRTGHRRTDLEDFWSEAARCKGIQALQGSHVRREGP